MKIIKEIMMSIALLLICYNLQADPVADAGKNKAVGVYINATVHGKPNGIGDAIDDNALVKVHLRNKIFTANKPQLVKTLKWIKDIEQNCQYTKSVLWEDDSISIQKLNMRYSDFTRTDVITLRQADDGWKITKVETSFK